MKHVTRNAALVVTLVLFFYAWYYQHHISELDKKLIKGLFTHDMFLSVNYFLKMYSVGNGKGITDEYGLHTASIYYIGCALFVLLLPFLTCLRKDPFMIIADASWYNYHYCIQQRGWRANLWDCKYKWYQFFKDHGVNTPEVVGVYDASTRDITLNQAMDDSPDNYILKPRCGGLGINIASFNNRDSLQTGTYVIQKRVFVCDQKEFKTFHFRITTIRDSTNPNHINVFGIYLMGLRASSVDDSKDRIASNHAQSAIVYDVSVPDLLTMRSITETSNRSLPNGVDRNLLRHVCRKLCDTHRIHFPLSSTFSIGWDVIMDCETYYVLEGNMGSSIIFTEDVFIDDLISKTKREYSLLNSLIK
jgi:hypothetical protein